MANFGLNCSQCTLSLALSFEIYESYQLPNAAKAYKLARCQLSKMAQKAAPKSNDTNNNNKLLLTQCFCCYGACCHFAL